MPFRQAAARFCKELRKSSGLPKICNSSPNTGKHIVSSECDFGGYTKSRCRGEASGWVFLSAPAALLLGSSLTPSLAEDVSHQSYSENDKNTSNKIPEEALISNEHTSKWRVFTDSGRDYFMQGNLEQAQKFFQSALQEAREGFGERDPHVASACNNLAELYRLKKDYENAEPLYVEAINILEEYYGRDDIRVGAALHNLGQFYRVLRKLENARGCYERALKIKRRVLGEFHSDYADTLYHLGTVLYLQGKEKDSQDLIADSIQILEAGELRDSALCVRRMQFLAQIYSKSNKLSEAEILLRKILHVLETSKGWKSLDTVVAAERLALAIQAVGKLREAEELLERCLDARKSLLPVDHIQNAANGLFLARVKMLISKTDTSRAMAEIDIAKNLLHNSVRVAQKSLTRSMEQKGKEKPNMPPGKAGKGAHSAMLILLQSMNALGSLELLKLEIVDSKKTVPGSADAAPFQCLSVYKEFEADNSISESPEIKSEYLSCLKLFSELMSKSILSKEKGRQEKIKDEIHRIEDELSRARND
ncbi:uncharacterized protein LOC127258509 [Andrographis paniculata]|uniref:uncharacterized protein LOC127258509 n=1 Tax=Andrographis paniculata TaxID=175694 RepID=UPI0021E8A521|nr:uncharacterized protein LOC127258509 [Andrographis paniculata]